MSITYTSYLQQISTLTVILSSQLTSGDNNFTGILPAAIDYAEGRIWRDLDLPAVRVTDTSVSCSSGVQSINLSTTQGTLLAIERLNLLTSAGATSSYASRVPLTPTSPAVIDCIYPSAASSNTGQPEYFARITDTQIIFGPTPDQAYGTEVTATTRPVPLSSGNSSTWLTQNLPEMMIAASMIFMSGHMRDFGAQSDNPQMAQSWESQYTALLKTAEIDALRMKFQADAWSAQRPSAPAQPPRG